MNKKNESKSQGQDHSPKELNGHGSKEKNYSVTLICENSTRNTRKK